MMTRGLMPSDVELTFGGGERKERERERERRGDGREEREGERERERERERRFSGLRGKRFFGKPVSYTNTPPAGKTLKVN